MGRSPCCDKTAVKRGPWSPEEDALLKNFIEAHGTGGNWIALPRKAGLNRCGKSCRLRWLNYLRPDIRHGGFTEEEDYIICTLFSAIGSRWSVIASKLPGRTDNDVKNYWNTKLKKKLPGFEVRSVCSNTTSSHHNFSQSVQPNSTQFTEVRPKLEEQTFGASNNSMPYCSSVVGMNLCENEVQAQGSWESTPQMFGGVSEVPLSRCSSIGGGGGGEVEDDIDDFWLRLLVDQSTFFDGSSQVVQQYEMINGFESVFDHGPVFPSFC